MFSPSAGHTLLDSLNNDGHLDATYADGTPPHHFSIDTPGLTTIQTVAHVTDRVNTVD